MLLDADHTFRYPTLDRTLSHELGGEDLFDKVRELESPEEEKQLGLDG